jgi:hypothetical protein
MTAMWSIKDIFKSPEEYKPIAGPTGAQGTTTTSGWYDGYDPTPPSVPNSGTVTGPAFGTYNITGGGGGGGAYLTTGAAWQTGISIASPTTPTGIELNGEKAIIKTRRNTIDLDEVSELLKSLQDAFCIIPKDKKLLDENPTLKDAYDQYQSILQEKFNDPRLKEAYNEYQLLKALSEEEKS